jgi:hypothetical protein
MGWTEENIETFIVENRDKFDRYDPSTYHSDHFLNMLHDKFKKLVSIVPYLVRVGIVTIGIFAISIWLWHSYIRHDKRVVVAKQKIENVIHLKKVKT